MKMHPIRWLRTKTQRDSARNLLRLELDSDLHLLAEWWNKIKPRKDQDEIHWVDKVVYAREFADAALPHFSRLSSSLQPPLSDYLSRSERGRLAQLHKDLGKIEEIQRALQSALEQDLALRRLPAGQSSLATEPPPTFEHFLAVGARHWFQAALLIDQILSRGNSLENRGAGARQSRKRPTGSP